MEAPGNDVSISFLDTKCSPNSDYAIHISVYRKPAHTSLFLDENSNHPMSAKKTVIHALIYRAKIFIPLLKSWLNKWTTSMEFCLNKYLHRLNDQRIRKESSNSHHKSRFWPRIESVSMRNLEESFNIPLYKSSSKDPTSSNLSLCILKITLHHN